MNRYMVPTVLFALAAAAFTPSCGGDEGSSTPDPGASSVGGAGGGAGAAAGGSAGAGGGAGGAPQGASGLPCDVETLMVTRCQTCHSDPPKFGAPMPLVTREHLAAPSQKDPSASYAQRAVARMRDAQSPMPQAPNPPATEVEIQALEAWVAAGAPAGQGCSGGGQGGAAGAGAGGQAGAGQGGGGPSKLLCNPDVSIKPTMPYAMPKDTADAYICYGIDLPGAPGKRHVTGVDAKIDNETIVHHILLFEAPTSEPSAPHPCKDLFPLDWKLIYAWAPGTGPYNLPEKAGYALDAGQTTHYVVQLHYSNITQLDGQVDATGVDLCTTDQPREFDADLIAIGGVSFKIPAHSKHEIECGLTVPTKGVPELNVFRAWPHMHQIGSKLSSRVLHAAGGESLMGVADPWNFYNQVGTDLSVKISPGDKIVTRCAWQNPGDKAVTFGEKTGDEMCFNFITYYPKLNQQNFSGITPAALSNCKVMP